MSQRTFRFFHSLGAGEGLLSSPSPCGLGRGSIKLSRSPSKMHSQAPPHCTGV